jgi:pantetheine-phosphate adenylyltransferase
LKRRPATALSNLVVTDGDQIMMVTDGGQLIRCPVHDIRIARRQTQGVTIFKVAEVEKVVAVAHMRDLGEVGGDENGAADSEPVSPDGPSNGQGGRYARGSGGTMAGKRIGVYPGTFDPVTNGHMDIVRRAMVLVDGLVIAVSIMAGKGPMLPLEDRVGLLREEVAEGGGINGDDIDVATFDSLLMRFVEEQGGRVIIRSCVRFRLSMNLMAGMNARLNPRIETALMASAQSVHFIPLRQEIGVSAAISASSSRRGGLKIDGGIRRPRD